MSKKKRQREVKKGREIKKGREVVTEAEEEVGIMDGKFSLVGAQELMMA